MHIGMVILNTTTLCLSFYELSQSGIFRTKKQTKTKINISVKQRTVDGGVSIATGLAFADLTEVSLDEVRALLLFLALLHLAGSKAINTVPDGHQLLHLKQIAREVLQNGNEVHNSCACRY